MSLRARLLLVLAALSIVGLLAADVATYTSERSFLTNRVDRSASAIAHGVEAQIVTGHFDPGLLRQLTQTAPGVYIGAITPDGAVRWRPPDRFRGQEALPEPRLSHSQATGADEEENFTVGSAGTTDYRAHFEVFSDGSKLVVAAPLNEVEASLHHLLLIELLVSLAVVAAIVGLGLWLVRLSLRPLVRIEETAGAIAGGDLSRRIEDVDQRTEVGRLSAALNAMLGQIEQAFAERTASEQRLRRFVGDASHELRTPLASVKAYAELFERGARDRPEDLARAMAGIEREAERMGVLVDDLLLLARLDQGRPLDRKEVDLAEVAREAVDVARVLEPGRPLALEAPEPVVVEGDPERLRQVVDNLLANVRAHTPATAAAKVTVARDDGQVVLEVADEGPGLTDEQAERVFERFYRGDASRTRAEGGTGLGLAIVAAIAHAHHGDVTVERGNGAGVAFRVSLPVRPA
ncbi:MAG TPA: HAMP domain-containing sensor histidine kinase [Gaiellaceae bacterium]